MSTALLKDKIILLTGGSCGIGRDCAKALPPRAPALSSLPAIPTAWEKTATELGSDHLGIVCDVTRDAEVKAAVEKAVAHYGRLDAIHNNAGIAAHSFQADSRNQ